MLIKTGLGNADPGKLLLSLVALVNVLIVVR